jgi:hypothetical protein
LRDERSELKDQMDAALQARGHARSKTNQSLMFTAEKDESVISIERSDESDAHDGRGSRSSSPNTAQSKEGRTRRSSSPYSCTSNGDPTGSNWSDSRVCTQSSTGAWSLVQAEESEGVQSRILVDERICGSPPVMLFANRLRLQILLVWTSTEKQSTVSLNHYQESLRQPTRRVNCVQGRRFSQTTSRNEIHLTRSSDSASL